MRTLAAYLNEIPGIEANLIAWSGGDAGRAHPNNWLGAKLYESSKHHGDPFGVLDSPAPALCDLATISSSGYDVLIWLSADRQALMNCRQMAKKAVFSIQLGEQKLEPPYWTESASGNPTSEVSIYWHDSSLQRGRLLRKAEVSSQLGLHFTENAKGPLLACERLLAALCLEVREQADQWRPVDSVTKLPETSVRGRGVETVGLLGAAQFAASKLVRSARLRWKARGKKPAWFIALRENRGASPLTPGPLAGFQPLAPPRGSAVMADPFLVEEAGRTWMLFEEIPVGGSAGRICSAEVLSASRIGERNVVLETGLHLSYPCTVRDRGELFIIPESSAANRLDLYRLGAPPYRAELAATLLDGIPLVDTTPIQLGGRWYFFATTAGVYLETLLYWSDRLEGPLHLHPASPISTSVRNSRGAGHAFYSNGRLYRPAQDCSIGYGYGITINEVIRLTPTEFEERPVRQIHPNWLPGLHATHTWNESSRYQAIDGFADLR